MSRITLGKVAERPGDVPTSTATGGSSAVGALEFLTSVTATNASVVSSGSFASVATKYIAIKIVAAGIRAATVSQIGIRTSSDGTNYSATTDAYAQSGYNNTATQTGGGILNENCSTSNTHIAFTDTATSTFLATSVGASLAAEITLLNLNATATNVFPGILFQASWMHNDIVGAVGFGKRKEAIAQGGVQLLNIGGGNFIDGRLDVFGIRGSP